jgi:hypothetical protein
MVIKMSLDQYRNWLGVLSPTVMSAAQRGMVSGAKRCVAILQDATRVAIPASANGGEGAFNTGAYLRAWKSQPVSDGARVFNDSSYGPIIEDGRKPGSKMPPKGVMARWAQRRLGLSREEALAIDFPLRRAIKDRGLRPRKVMANSLEQMTAAVDEEVMREVDAELNR